MNATATSSTRSSSRAQTGNTIAETGPALFILVIMLFFPLLDLCAMGMSYCSCYSLNDLQIREAANLPKSEADQAGGAVRKSIPEQWKSQGIGRFVGVVGDPQTKIEYIAGETDGNGITDRYVVVTTTLQTRPFLTIPFFVGMPGLSSPATYSITQRRLLENPNNANS